MATSKYFNLYQSGHTGEQDMLHNMSKECIQINGLDCYYLPRTLVKEDSLFGEDVLSEFNTTYEIEAYVESFDNYEGSGDLLASFGLNVTDELNLTVATRRFTEVTSMKKPLEGDLIYFPLGKALFEIKFVEDEQPFYPLGTLPSYSLRCKLYDHSHETITPLSAVDGLLTTDDDINAAYDTPTSTTDGTTEPTTIDDPYANNDEIETEAINVIDFSESNPFGSF